MSIEGMVAANSTIEKNLPGSEVYLAPVANTIEGSYAIPYQVSFKERVLPNLKLVFKQGVLTEYDVYYADENDPRKKTDLEYIEKTLGIDEGSRKIGELGIGTNPHIRKSFINTILIEKAVGVHLALGNSYANNYDGQDINIDNGNRSANHIDIALIMLPEFGGGEMIVDGEVIQKDGVFLDPELAVLNH